MGVKDKDARIVYEAIQKHNQVFPENKVVNFALHPHSKTPSVEVFVSPPLNYKAHFKLEPPQE